jgi:glycosyltransferase involved in cell wall biosynthesis
MKEKNGYMSSAGRSLPVDISVVIPVYGCRQCLAELYRRLVISLESITENFEIILVNDSCPQNSWEEISEIAAKDMRVVGIDLSRNFGQIRAITAGLEYASGEWVVVMDCDLQDRPEEIPRLFKKAKEGYDVVFARRAERKDSLFKKLANRIFYAIYGYFTDWTFDSAICNFSISRKIVIENYRRMGDQNRAYILFIKWMGFKTTAIDVEHNERASGDSSYTLKKQLRLAGEIITTQSNKPLIISIKFGATVAVISAIGGLIQIFKYFYYGSVMGWTSLIVSIYFIGGITLTQLGILGLYIGYVFNQTKGRPIYIVRELVSHGRSSIENRPLTRDPSTIASRSTAP